MPFWREYYIILFDDDHIFVIMYYEKCIVDKMTELPKTLSEYYGYGGTASKIFFKAGGVVGIGMALNDIQKDSRLYSGWNRYRAWGADLTPIIAGIAGGGAGSIFGVPAAGGILGGIGGDYLKEYVKARIPTDKEEEVRKYYQEFWGNYKIDDLFMYDCNFYSKKYAVLYEAT